MFKYIKVFSLLCAPWLFETGPPILRHIVWICLECSLRPEIRLAPWLRLLHIEEPFVTQAFDFLLDTARWEDLDGLTAISLQVSSVSVSRCIKIYQDVSSLVAIECCKLLQKLRIAMIAQLSLALGTSVDEQTHCNPTEPGGTRCMDGFFFCMFLSMFFAGRVMRVHGLHNAMTGCCCKDYDWLFWVDCDLFFMNPATGAKSQTSLKAMRAKRGKTSFCSQVPKYLIL